MSIKYHRLLNSFTGIRLLELQPAKEESAPLKGRLIHTYLKDSQYQALSYVWGDSKADPIDIEITYQPESSSSNSQGSEVFYSSVGQNLGTALKHLRQSEKVLVLWADAICIDQGENEEKSHQVKIMYSIFQNAFLVVAWLGPSGPYTRIAIEQVKRIGHDLKLLHYEDAQDLNGFINWLGLKWKSENPVDDRGNHIGVLLRKLSPLLEQDVDFVNGILDLYGRSYWSRVWVVQEYLAAPDICIRCGHQTLSVQDFYKIAALQYSYETHIGSKIWTQFTKDLPDMNPAPPFHVLASLHSFQLGKEYFPRLIIRVNGPVNDAMGATDPRDRIFALLGAADNTYGLEPDYAKDAARVFLDTTIAFLEHGYLWPLNFGIYGHDSPNPKWPSWMVDWSSMPRRTHKDGSYYSTTIDGQIGKDKAEKLERPSVSFQTSSTQSIELVKPRLSIQGLSVSTIALITPSFQDLEPLIAELPAEDEPTLSELLLELDPFMLLLKAWLNNLQSSMSDMLTGTESDVEDRISNVIMRFLRSPTHTSTGLLIEEFEAMLTGVIASLITNSDHRLKLHKCGSEVFLERLERVLAELIPTYIEHKEERWVILLNGYIGHSAYPVQKGDVIALFGAPSGEQCCVFVLREVEDNLYRIIGKVHMPDVDKDELWEEDRDIATFTII